MMGPTLPQLRARMDEVIKISLNLAQFALAMHMV
jgi:hypothetical protein